ncbi:CU044_2847 family protein [Herbidospora cretacea]|uniref:CU044_2847 family protein n=1 Tax=Herbidospora cretacea TaxID=28444 RepID=UPI0007C749F4|nr:CU044_2847 family protein [Herbidospora cretacea]
MTHVVRYEIDENTTVGFEVAPIPGYHAAGAGEIAGPIRQAVEPAIRAARAVLDKAKEARPDEISLKFGIKVSGTTNWLVAKAATEGNFEITMVWKARPDGAGTAGPPGEEGDDASANEDDEGDDPA